MDFAWTPEQLEFRRAVVEFARRGLQDDLVRRDQTGEFSRELWTRCAEFGIQGLPFPEEYGGGGADILTTVLAMEALGYGCKDNGLLFGLAAQMWSVQMPLFRFGTEDQRRRYLARLNRGEWIGAHAMSEPGSGSDAFALSTRAERRGDGYVLNGAKTFVSEAPVADLFLVFATLDPSKGVLGITGFLVERGTPGLVVGRPIAKLGLKTSPMAELVFEDCPVPAANRLGREGRGAEIFNDAMEWERACILACQLGAMERQLEQSVAYARERKQFGKPIGEFQAVAHRLVAMKVRLEAARGLLYRGAWLKQTAGTAGADAAIAKLFLSEAWVRSCLDAIQIHGGYGFTTEYEVERDLRDSIGGTLYSGTSEIQRNLIARSLGL
ncbi:MAG TPA: acyl-CoA dehydrogenase family protein [Gemmatimonadales bacterium]|jgi:alkylation response protein AidB-like acyl-CoA dehydrogenase|nr:acyl-CoA dehydrogenase family protein [Gemmatimonadales bacterium]